AAGVSVSGRVTTPDGRGLRNAKVVITDSLGNARTVTTSSFGFYQFDEVAVGDSYVIGVVSKQYRFITSQLVQLGDTLTDVNFVGQE
ncbi:MAG: carboxypeptidase-like regulatory domain-containing protein, partial [Acidobacteriota bacterium]